VRGRGAHLPATQQGAGSTFFYLKDANHRQHWNGSTRPTGVHFFPFDPLNNLYNITNITTWPFFLTDHSVKVVMLSVMLPFQCHQFQGNIIIFW